MAWTDEQRAAIFKAFYADGESAATIAARYGVARNAIIGVAHRMRARAGAPKKRPPAAREARPSPAAKAHNRRRTWHMQAAAPVRDTMFRESTPPISPPAAASALVYGFALKSLGRAQCRFAVTPHDAPRDGHLFCGALAEGPFCPRHSLIVYQRPPA